MRLLTAEPDRQTEHAWVRALRTGETAEVPLRGSRPARTPAAQQGHRVHRRRARRLRPARPAADARAHDRGAGRPRDREQPPQGRRPRAVHRPGRAAGPQRDALLPRARRPPRGAPADRLHADRRRGLPGVQPHLPAAPRALDHARRRRPDPRAAPQRPARGRPPDRGHRQRADPRPRRPGRGRDGDPGRQARPLHGRRGRSTRRTRCRSASTSAPTTRTCSADPLYLGWRHPRLRGRGVRRVRRGVRRGGARGLPARRAAVGGLQAAQRVPPARPLPAPDPLASTTTSRARPPWCWAGSCHRSRILRRAAVATSGSSSSAPARPASASRGWSARRWSARAYRRGDDRARHRPARLARAHVPRPRAARRATSASSRSARRAMAAYGFEPGRGVRPRRRRSERVRPTS